MDAESDFEGLSFSFDKEYRFVPDAYLALPYAVFGQTVSLLSSIKVGNKPDTPSPTGTVNRVVKRSNDSPIRSINNFIEKR